MRILPVGMLHRIARRCPTHDAPSQHRIRALEQELGMEQSPPSGDLVDQLYDPLIVDCGLAWCSRGRQ
jgi:hypothetical protein